ncbi:MAG TPA: hypothetical protein VKB23_00455 [Solirubrobacterales bacterium]|nr:hypothetical protein [Solirubrobacterales bacterium]
MRSVLLTVLVGLCAAIAPAAAVAEPLPPYDGLMTFPDIQGPEGPEVFSWAVKLGEGEELRAIDETQAGVFWEEGTQAMTIDAVKAHDAIGSTVPTTLSVTQPNAITLTVHHRGAPFDYPVAAGAGWEGGIQSVEIEGPPDEFQLAHPPTPGILEPPPAPTCVVPDLTGRTLRASRRTLHSAHCSLGLVRGKRSRRVRVAMQYRLAGRVLPVWTAVGVKAVAPDQYSRGS